MTYVIRGIPYLLVPRMWLFAEPYIKRALDHAAGEINCDDLRKSCMERDVQLWLVACGERIVGAATTEIVQYPHRKHCRIITVAGSEFKKWVELLNLTLEKWAVEQECDAMESHVRRGMVPVMAELGYKHLHSVVHKKIDIMPNGMCAGEAAWERKAEAVVAPPNR